MLGFVATFNPLSDTPSGHIFWLIGSLTAVFSGLSIIYINYLALGTEIGESSHHHTQIAGNRAFFAVMGIIAVLIIPEIFTNLLKDSAQAISIFTVWFAVTFLAILGIFLILTPRPKLFWDRKKNTSFQWSEPLKNKRFRGLIYVFALSGLSNAIPGLLILFFIDDVLQTPNIGWLFILIYFVSSGFAIPVWVKFAKRVGKIRAWYIGMGLSILSFCGAFSLGVSDIYFYAVICLMSGLANGADLTVPFSILADTIKSKNKNSEVVSNASYFGIWQFIEKSNLGLAAGCCLPILGYFGYQPGQAESNTDLLKAMYSIFPCCLKFTAMIMLRKVETAKVNL